MTLTSPWTLVVKQDSVTGVHAIGFSVVDYYPVGVQLGHTWNIKQTDIQVTMYPSMYITHTRYPTLIFFRWAVARYNNRSSKEIL